MNKKTVDLILNDPCTSYWLKDAILTSFNRDVVDALRDAETLTQLLNERCNEAFKLSK